MSNTEIDDIRLLLQRGVYDMRLLDSDEPLLTGDNRRGIMGVKVLRQLDILKIFPWITDKNGRIRNSGVTEESLKTALRYFCQPFSVQESEIIVACFDNAKVAELKVKKEGKLSAIIELADICVQLIGRNFSEPDINEQMFNEISSLVYFPEPTQDSIGVPSFEYDMPEASLDDESIDICSGDDGWKPEHPFDQLLSALPSPHTDSNWGSCGHDDSNSSTGNPNLDGRVNSLEGRVDTLEEGHMLLEDRVDILEGGRVRLPSGKFTREGRDRAAWMKIKPAYVATRNKWCKPGAVMAIFPKGLAPIDSKAPVHNIMGVVVYSTDPDTIEALPYGYAEQEWAPIVLIGEAPVNLSSYDNYKSKKFHKKNSTVYVHLMSGKVDVCEGARVPPRCVRIGLAKCDHTQRINDIPYFQNTKGVCTSISGGELESIPKLPSTLFTRDISQHAMLAARKTKKMMSRPEVTNVCKIFSSMTISSPPDASKIDIPVVVSGPVEAIGMTLAISAKGRLVVNNVRRPSAAATHGIVEGDKVKTVDGCSDTNAAAVMAFIQSAPRPLRIVIRHRDRSGVLPAGGDTRTGR